jgi:hypothetical protein
MYTMSSQESSIAFTQAIWERSRWSVRAVGKTLPSGNCDQGKITRNY